MTQNYIMELLHHMNEKIIFSLFALFIIGSLALTGCGDSDSDEAGLQQEEQYSAEDPAVTEEATLKAAGLTDSVAALVNGEQVTVDELAARLHIATRQFDEASTIDQYTLNRLRENALQALINERLIMQQAVKQQVTVSEEEIQQQITKLLEDSHAPDIETVLEEQGSSYEQWEKNQRDKLLLEKLVELNMSSMIDVLEEEVRQDYEQNKEKYDHAAQVRASQILTYDESLAQQALQELQNGVDFVQVARKYSESQDADAGGDLGYFEQGVMPPEFDEVIFSLNLGEISPIVKTSYGYQIFTLTERRDASRMSFEEAKSQIEERLKQQKRMFAIELWILDLQKEAKILLNHTAIKQVQ